MQVTEPDAPRLNSGLVELGQIVSPVVPARLELRLDHNASC